jgi:hypothetical protein
MGTNINGSVEVTYGHRDPPGGPLVWHDVVWAGILLNRNYNAFGCLFGVRNYSGFVPIAPERGLPSDPSRRVREQAERPNSDYSHSWVTWAELKGVDWTESVVDAWVHQYRKSKTGYYVEFGARMLDPPGSRQEGESWQEGDVLCRVERIARRQSLDDTYEMVFEVMETLAKRFGDDQVRLVVWFDN